MPFLTLLGLLAALYLGQVGSNAFAQSGPDELTGRPSLQNVAREEFEIYSDTPNQVFGFYSNGRLESASALPPDAFGFLKLFQPRQRQFGAQGLVEAILEAAKTVKEQFPEGERLQVGDLSQQTGGKITLHASHQNGLDADFAYYRVDRREQNPQLTNGFDEVFVKEGAPTENLDLERFWALLKALHRNAPVTRVFMDGAIKRALCTRAEQKEERNEFTEVLRSLRPLGGHADHFHVRIACPATSPGCVAQDPPPAGDGCSEVWL